MVFQCINICQVPREVLKTVASSLGFQHLPQDLANVNTWKTMFDSYIIIYYFSIKTYVVGTHSKRLTEAFLMSNHNICFHGKIKLFLGYCLLPGALFIQISCPGMRIIFSEKNETSLPPFKSTKTNQIRLNLHLKFENWKKKKIIIKIKVL